MEPIKDRSGGYARHVSASSRVFIARLAGMGVFDPSGDQVGKVRDVVITLRSGALPPRVLGLVVEVYSRRRIFCPMGRVRRLEAGAVVVSGTLNMRRFEPRPGELLVVSELLDKSVRILETDERVTVQDIAMEQERSLDWMVTRIFVKKPGKGLRRRGETVLVDWDAVEGLSLADPRQGTESLLATVASLRPADLAGVLHELSPGRRVALARGLEDEKLADVLEELPEDDRVEIIAGLEDERAADILEEMDPDDAADLLGELPTEVAESLLALVEPEEAQELRRLLVYDDYTAGGLMTTEPVILSHDATVADALARIRDRDLPPSLAAQVYVTRAPFDTPTGRYIGTAHFQRLLREPPATLVSAVIDADLEPVGPDAPLEELTRIFATYNLVAMPVVDGGNHLVGTVTVDDLIDHMLPDNWRDTVTAAEAAQAGEVRHGT